VKKTLAPLFLLSLLFVCQLIFTKVIEGTTIHRLESQWLHWKYLHQAIFFFGIPLSVVILLKRKPSCYALCWNRHALISVVTILSLTIVLPILADLITGKLRPAKASLGYLLSTLVFQVIISGCGEELTFRGMYQAEMDRVSRRRFRIGNTHFGIGLFVGAFFFGLWHLDILGYLNGGDLNYQWLFLATMIGLFLGFAREFVGCIWIVGCIHASYDTYYYLVKPSIAGAIVHVAAITIVHGLLFSRRLHAGKAEHRGSVDAAAHRD